jgi:hypothetical protein
MSIKLWIAAAAAIAVAGPALAKSNHHSHVLMELTGPIPYAQLAAADAFMAKAYAEIDRELSYGRMSRAEPALAKSNHHSHVLMELTGPIPYAQLTAADAFMAREYAEIDRERSYGRMSRAEPALANHHSHVLTELTGPIPYAQLAAADAFMAKEYAEIDRERSYGRMSSFTAITQGSTDSPATPQ